MHALVLREHAHEMRVVHGKDVGRLRRARRADPLDVRDYLENSEEFRLLEDGDVLTVLVLELDLPLVDEVDGVRVVARLVEHLALREVDGVQVRNVVQDQLHVLPLEEGNLIQNIRVDAEQKMRLQGGGEVVDVV